MSIMVEKRSISHFDYGDVEEGMPATTSICIALVVALILYVAGSAVFQRDVATGAPPPAFQSVMSFHGP